jgi:transposase-like protein
MKKINSAEGRRCPKCGLAESQINAGYSRSGTQRCVCKECRHKHTLNGKAPAYSEEFRQQALRTHYSGVSGRGAGKIMGMSKANVCNRTKKTPKNKQPESYQQVFNGCYVLDELYWFIEKKAKHETRENVYLMTMINPEPRQIVGFEAAMDKGTAHIQNIADNAPWAERYATDGCFVYCDAVFPGEIPLSRFALPLLLGEVAPLQRSRRGSLRERLRKRSPSQSLRDSSPKGRAIGEGEPPRTASPLGEVAPL